MHHPDDENTHFKMRLEDEVEETPLPVVADDLRLEKMNTRITMITILIPVLIVVVLVIAYLDIKKRVIKTEDTGTMSLQSLSKDVESRFSSLSVRQAALEESVARLNDESSKSMAGIQIKLKSISDSMGQIKESAASRSELKSMNAEMKGVAADLTKKVENVAGAVDEVQTHLSQLTVDLQGLRGELNDGLLAGRNHLAKIDERTNAIQRDKVDKAAVDLAVRLESLKIEQLVKSRIEELRADLNSLEKKMSQKAAASPTAPSGTGSASPARPPAASAPAASATPAPPTARPEVPGTGGIEEQTIKP